MSVSYLNEGKGHQEFVFSIFEQIKWDKFFTLVNKIGVELDERINRFDKSTIFEIAVEKFSMNFIKRVDSIGHDHIMTFLDNNGSTQSVKIEQKSAKNCLFTKKGNRRKNVNIRLNNSLGDSSNKKRSEILKFDYLLIIDTGGKESYSVGYVKSEHISDYELVRGSDCVILNISSDKIRIVKNPKQIEINKKTNYFSYSERKIELMRSFIDEF